MAHLFLCLLLDNVARRQLETSATKSGPKLTNPGRHEGLIDCTKLLRGGWRIFRSRSVEQAHNAAFADFDNLSPWCPTKFGGFQ